MKLGFCLSYDGMHNMMMSVEPVLGRWFHYATYQWLYAAGCVGCCRLLCAVVDNVEALLDEWFPGLRDFDILSGDELVQPMALCPLCPSEWLSCLTPSILTLTPNHLSQSISVTWFNFDPVYKYFYSDTQITSQPFPPHSYPQSPQPPTASDWNIFNKRQSLLMRWSVPDTTDQCYLSNWYDNLWQPQPATQPSDLFSLFAARLRLPRLTYSTVMPQRSHIGTNSVPSCICG